jgi:hypothetical protein
VSGSRSASPKRKVNNNYGSYDDVIRVVMMESELIIEGLRVEG